MDVRLIGIDWQNDFCDPNGSLFVPGAEEDAKRCATMINRLGKKITGIHTTLDSHHFVDIAHPIFLVDSEGHHPEPFTTIVTSQDIDDGVWRATNPQYQKWIMEYVHALEDNGRYPWCIWPPHCLIGSWGTIFPPILFEALIKWESSFRMVDKITKGSNFLTEHYSAVQADVPRNDDPGTLLNTKFIDHVETADIIGLTGQALDFCLANTVRDMSNRFGDESIKKLVLITDCTSSVNAPGLEHLGEDFIKEMIARGIQISTSTEFLA